ncbi:UNVERIFIED_CONTAM: hypothetical protein Sradi_7074500 [Sesamum radiatum]|uniref:Uncharacterized protein n=1 Tax=Sesamum radiatum TaxID=300843 RepID=A0AAW2J4S0_SESRA
MPSPPLPPPGVDMEDWMVRLKTMMVNMMGMMKSMQANASTFGLSHPSATSNGSSQPPADPHAPNDDNINHADKGSESRLGTGF